MVLQEHFKWTEKEAAVTSIIINNYIEQGYPSNQLYDKIRLIKEVFMLIEKLDKNQLAFWIHYENPGIYYCRECCFKRINEINKNQEFSEFIDYSNGEKCSFLSDFANIDKEVTCTVCNKRLLSNLDKLPMQPI